jgi:hypothetical protein
LNLFITKWRNIDCWQKEVGIGSANFMKSSGLDSSTPSGIDNSLLISLRKVAMHQYGAKLFLASSFGRWDISWVPYFLLVSTQYNSRDFVIHQALVPIG